MNTIKDYQWLDLNSKFILFVIHSTVQWLFMKLWIDFDELSWKGKVLWCAITLLPNLVFYQVLSKLC